MSENGLSMIDLVLTHLDHCWGPPWWFGALKSVPVIHFDHSEMLENGHFCHVKSCKSQKRHVNHALFQSEVQYNHVLINPCFIFRVFGWLFPQAFCVDLDIIWGWSLKTLKKARLSISDMIKPPPVSSNIFVDEMLAPSEVFLLVILAIWILLRRIFQNKLVIW